MSNVTMYIVLTFVSLCPIISILLCLKFTENGNAYVGFLIGVLIALGYWCSMLLGSDSDFDWLPLVANIFYTSLVLGTIFCCLGKLMSKK